MTIKTTQSLKCWLCALIVFVTAVTSSSAMARSLKDSANEAILSHPAYQRQQLALDSVRQAAQIVTSENRPQVKLSAGVGPEQSNNATTRSVTGGDRNLPRRESQILVRQKLFDGFASTARSEAAAETIQLEQLKTQLEASQIVLDAVEAHLNVILAKDNIRAAKTSFNAHQKVYDAIKERAEQGKDNKASLSQVEARFALAEANWLLSHNRYDTAIGEYERLVGNLSSELQGTVFNFDGYPYFDELAKADYLESVFDRSVQRGIQKLQIEVARSSYYESKASRLPKVFLEAGASWNQDLDGLDGRNRDAFVMLKLDYDLYQGGAKKSLTKQARNTLSSETLQLEQVERDLRYEAGKVWSDYQSASRRLSVLQGYTKAAKETRDAYEKQFSIGYRSLLNLLDAEIELYRAILENNEAAFAKQVSAYRMFHVDNRLLETFEINVIFEAVDE